MNRLVVVRSSRVVVPSSYGVAREWRSTGCSLRREGQVRHHLIGGGAGAGHEHKHKHEREGERRVLVESREARKVTWIGLWCDVSLCVSKGWIGYLSGSAGLLSDAVHSLSDLASGVVTLASINLGRRPPDNKHPYGYGHYESLGALLVGSMLITGSLASARFSLTHLLPLLTYHSSFISTTTATAAITPEIEHTSAAIACAFSALVVKEALFKYTLNLAKKQNSPVLVANAWHHRSDSLTSLAAMVGIGGYLAGFPIMDPLVGLAVAAIVGRTGLSIGWDAVSNLTDRKQVFDDEISMQVVEIASEEKDRSKGEILGVHDIRSRKVGKYTLLDLHVEVDNRLSLTAAYEAVSKLRKAIKDQVPTVYEVFTHVQAHSHSEKNDGHNRTTQVRGQFEIEQDIVSAIDRAKKEDIGARGIKGVSHCAVHFYREPSIEGSILTKAEVNLDMDDQLTLSQARAAAEIAKKYVLKVNQVDQVDVHVEILSA